MVGMLAPNATHSTRGFVKYVLGKGYFHAVSSQNGDKIVTSPPASIVERILKRAVPTRVNIIALAAELGIEVAVAVDLSISLSLSLTTAFSFYCHLGNNRRPYWDHRHAAIGSGGGAGSLRTAIKRVRLSAPREQRAVGASAQTPSVSAAVGAPIEGEN